MKKILVVGEAYSGGVKTYIDTIMKNRQHFMPISLTALVSSRRLDKNEEMGIEYLVDDNLSFGHSPLKLAKALVRLNRIVKRNNIEVIHANSKYAGVVLSLYTCFNRSLLSIYTPHGYYSLKKMNWIKKNIVKSIEKKINGAADLVIHVSPSEEFMAITNRLIKKEKSLVILNGVKDPEVKTSRQECTKFTIVNFARLEEPKNPQEFIEIAQKLIRVIPNLQFIWAGNGRFLDESREKVKEYNLEDKIKFIGYSREKEKILSQADLYFSPSQYEGLPFAVVEAMSYKLPLLLSDIVGHADLIEKTENGILFEENEINKIIEFVQSLIDDNVKWRRLSANSFRIFNQRFSVDEMLEKLAKVYENPLLRPDIETSRIFGREIGWEKEKV